MKVTELNRDQLLELKWGYLTRLADEGRFAETFGKDYNEPSWGDLYGADDLVSDETIFAIYEGTYFVNDDFQCSCSRQD